MCHRLSVIDINALDSWPPLQGGAPENLKVH
jgi:hypothetical protein